MSKVKILSMAVCMSTTIVATTFSAGCVMEREAPMPSAYDVEVREDTPSAWAESPPMTEPHVEEDGLLSGHLTGTMGPVTVDTDAVHFNTWKEQTFTEINTVAPDADGGAAMTILLFNGPLSELEVGVAQRFSWDGNGTNDGMWVDAIGCSGPQEGRWTYFDVPAEEVDVVVDEGEEPGTRVLAYAAHFDEGYTTSATTVMGHIVYNVDEMP